MNLRVCLPQLLAGVHQEFVGEHVRQNASVCGMSAYLWLVSRSLSLVLDKVVAVADPNSVLASQNNYIYNTSLTQQIFPQMSAACYWQTSQYIITVCRIPDNYGVIWCAQVRFSIIRAKSAKAFDSCPASRQLYKALL